MRDTIKKINYYFQFVSGFVTIALMLLTVLDVILRYFFNAPIGGTYELTCLVLTIIVFFAVGYSQEFNEHVVIDILYDHLPRKAKWVMSLISTLIYLAIVVLMFWTVAKYSITLISTNAQTPILKIPHWPLVIASAVGLFSYILALINDLLFVKDGGVLSNDPN